MYEQTFLARFDQTSRSYCVTDSLVSHDFQLDFPQNAAELIHIALLC